MERGRPKAIIKRDVQLNLKLTKFEAEKISKIAEKKNITKTELIVRAIKVFETHKPKKYKNLNENSQKNSIGVIEGEIIPISKK